MEEKAIFICYIVDVAMYIHTHIYIYCFTILKEVILKIKMKRF